MIKRRFKRESWHFFVEIIIIFAAVLIFRSSWLILDSYEIFNELTMLIILLILGIIVTIIGFNYLFKHEKQHERDY